MYTCGICSKTKISQGHSKQRCVDGRDKGTRVKSLMSSLVHNERLLIRSALFSVSPSVFFNNYLRL